MYEKALHELAPILFPEYKNLKEEIFSLDDDSISELYGTTMDSIDERETELYFLEAEAEARENQKLPPYGKLASIILSGADRSKVLSFSKELLKKSPHYDNVTILGPVPAPLSYLRGNYRYRFLIKADIEVNLQKTVRDWLSQMKTGRGIRVQIDIDPYSFY